MQKLHRNGGRTQPVPRDEISLVDVVVLVWRRRYAAAATLSTIVACGLAVALLQPKTFVYTTTIEIGSQVDNKKSVPIESVDTTLNKLKERYIPLAQRSYQQGHPQDRRALEVTASAPKDSKLVVLTSKASEADSARYRQIQVQAAQDLLADHGRVSERQRAVIGWQQQRAEAALRALVDAAAVIERQCDRLEQTGQLLEQQMAGTRALIDHADKNHTHSVGKTRAVTQLMLDNEVRANQARQADLRLQLGLEERREQLQRALRKNKRDQVLQRAEIGRLNVQLKYLQETRALEWAVRSPQPTGASPRWIAAVSLMVGCLMAVSVPLVLEFIHRVRQSLAAGSIGDQRGGN